MEKLYVHQKNFLKMAGGRMHITLILSPWIRLWHGTAQGPPFPLNTHLLWAMQKYFRSLCLKAEAWLKQVKGGCNHY